MSIIATIASVVAIIGTPIAATFAVRNFHYNQNAPVRQRQEKLRTELKQRVTVQNRLVHAIKNLDKHLPSSLVNDDLAELRSYINGVKHQFIAPTPDQLAQVVKTLDGALEALDVAQHEPKNDTAFVPHVQEIKGKVLRPSLEKALEQINVLLNGLSVIEMKTLSVRKQKELFRELDPPR